MPHLETPDELAEWVADWLGVYGSVLDDDHDARSHKASKCRVCFVAELAQRIRDSVENEQALQLGAGAVK